MFDSGFLVCFSLVLFVIGAMMATVALVKIAGLRDRLQKLETQVARLLLEQTRRPRETEHETIRVPALAPPTLMKSGPAAVEAAPPPTAKAVISPIQPLSPSVPTPESLRQKQEMLPEMENAESAAYAPVVEPAKPLTDRSEDAAAWKPAAAAPRSVASSPARPPVVKDVAHTGPSPSAGAKPGLEAYLGTKLFVVIGAIALGLAGILLVKYMADRGYFNPQTRVILGALAGLALIGVAQWRRKFEPLIAQGLSAAGIVALFAAIYAATTIYSFLAPASGFILLACVTALAVGLSLQKPGGGPLMATLGLIGGFITPLLVQTESPNVAGLFGYLLLLHVGLIAVTRMRGWPILAALSVLFSSAWMIGWMAWFPWNPADGPYLGTFLLASVISLIVTTVNHPEKWRGGGGNFAAMALTWLAAVMGLVTACLFLGKSGFSNMEWGFFAALTAGAFVLGRLRSAYEPMTWLSAATVLAMLTAWGLTGGPYHRWISDPVELERLRWLMAGFGAASVLGAYVCQWGTAAPVRWSMLVTVMAVAYVATAYGVAGRPPRADEWAYVPLAAAAVLAALAVPVFLRRGTMRTGEEALTVYAHGALALLAISPPMALADGALTVAWAALLPLTALALWRLRLPALVMGLLGVFAILAIRAVAPGTLMEMGGPETASGHTLWWNPVVWTYGSMVVAMILSVWLVERPGLAGFVPENLAGVLPSAEAVSAALLAGAAAAGFLLLTLLVRWHFHDGRLDERTALLSERSTYAVGWLLMACALIWLGGRSGRTVIVRCGEVAGVIGMLYTVLGLAVISNPWWWGDNVGTWRVINILLYAYGAPALLCGAMAYLLAIGKRGQARVAAMAGVTGLVLLFVLTSMEVRQGFQGEYLNAEGASNGEMVAYSLAWAGLGGVLLVAGILRWSVVLRWASLVLMFVTVFKVFIFDMAGLKDLLRVLSFAGLGVSLMALAFVYQHFVFGKKPAVAEVPQEASEKI